MSNRVFVVGVGMTKFEKPGRRDWTYPDMARESGTNALEDAGIPYAAVEHAFVGYVYGDSTSGQRAIYELGLTGLPVVNVNNNCSTGSSALYLARQAVRYGMADCVMALGFEQMQPGSLTKHFPTHVDPIGRHAAAMREIYPAPEGVPRALEMFGDAAIEHMQQYGSTPEHFAWIGWKNHKHSVNNPYAQFQREYTLEEVKDAQHYHGPLTKLQCSPTSDGSAAAILASERFVDQHGLWEHAIEIRGQALVTDMPSTFEARSCRNLVGYDMARVAAQKAYEEALVGAEDIDVIELHDCFSSMELLTYEALGLAAEGEGHKLIDAHVTTYGGSGPVVNPSGGLISKGHPLGATGLAQCSELNWQLRGAAGKRQVEGARIALQHNVGLGGAAVVTIYAPPDAA